jgi:hypothetical protein
LNWLNYNSSPCQHVSAQSRQYRYESAAINDFLAAAVIGGPETVRTGFEALSNATGADKFMLVCDVFDPALRLHALDIAAEACAQAELEMMH